MRRSRIGATGVAVPLLVAASSLVARPAAAQTSADYVSPGVLFSFDLTKSQAFGLGAEVSFNRFPNYRELRGFGGFGNVVYYFRPEYTRVAIGGQIDAVVGAEAGWAFHTAPLAAYGAGASTGPMLGAFGSLGVFMIALRGTFGAFGNGVGNLTVDLGLKVPLLVEGRHIQTGINLGGSGRPHRVDGAVAIAGATAEFECPVDPSLRSALGRSARNALGRLWLEDARLEHSAVSAFLTLAGELAALGAPPSLVRRALDAARDETVHTRLCLEAARRHTGIAWTLPAFRPAEAPRQSIGTLVRESWEDGCLGEGLAARAAREGASHCRDAWTRATFETIARDESRHADLAWRILEWCLALPGAAGEEARSTLSLAVDSLKGFAPPPLPALSATTLRTHGRVSREMHIEIAERGLDASRRLARSMLLSGPGVARRRGEGA
jgi:hypothetical protein